MKNEENFMNPFLGNNNVMMAPRGGQKYRNGETSSHMNFELDSPNHKRCKDMLAKSLSIFHDYAEHNNFLYTLEGGSLIGHYWNNEMIFWDDDIDIHVEDCVLDQLTSIWEGGEFFTNEYLKNYCGVGKKSKYGCTLRKIYLLDKPCLICFGGGRETDDGWHPIDDKEHGVNRILFKLIALDDNEQLITFDRRKHQVHRWTGLDIIITQQHKDKKQIFDSWFTKKEVPWFQFSENKLDFPIVNFNGVETRAVIKERGEPWLDEMYGEFWRSRKHESLKEQEDNCADFRFRKK